MSIFTACVQSGVLSAVSNIIAQLLACWQSKTPYTLDVVRLLQFVSFSVLACPPNYLWQRFLENQFPAYAPELDHTEKGVLVHDTTSGRSTGVEKATQRRAGKNALTEKSEKPVSKPASKRLSIKNTAIKFSLDQTIGAAVNTVMFIAGIALIRGQSLESAISDVQEQYLPMTMAGLKLWPAVSILSFSVIPLEHRMLFGSVAGLFWGVFLSLAAGSSKRK